MMFSIFSGVATYCGWLRNPAPLFWMGVNHPVGGAVILLPALHNEIKKWSLCSRSKRKSFGRLGMMTAVMAQVEVINGKQ